MTSNYAVSEAAKKNCNRRKTDIQQLHKRFINLHLYSLDCNYRWFLAMQKIDTVVRENLLINFGSDISVALASQRKIL